MSNTVPLLPLYRDYLRAIRQLPHLYLRQFYRQKVRDDIEKLRSTTPLSLQRKKYKRIYKELRKMNKGLEGDWRSFDHVLDVAYGRKGKFKHELMQPFLSDPNAQVLPPIIPAMPNSRPPIYSPELRTLLTSEISRKTKPLRPSAITRPPTLPPQANPSSEEANLFGVLSKRRKKNILHRFFTQEVQKVYPPLEVKVQGGHTIQEMGLRAGAAQGLNLLEDIEAVIGPVWKPPQLTRRERRALPENVDPSNPTSQRHPSRWLRRRYQSLLGRLPILIYTPGQKPGGGGYSIEHSPKSLGDLYHTGGRLLPVAAAAQLAWYESSLVQSGSKAKK